MRRLTGGVLALTVALATAACDPAANTTPTTPTTPTVPVTEIFSGTLNANGAATFTFSVSVAGIVTATLRSLSPDNTISVGLALGTWNGVTCQVVLANDKTTAGITVTGATSAAGSLCVRIYDVGQITQPTTFEIQVVHP